MPHEALPVGEVPRLSLTVPLQPVGAATNVDHAHRVEPRLRAIQRRDLEFIRADVLPFAEGLAHKRPQREAELLRYFEPQYGTDAQIEAFLSGMGLGSSEAAA